MKKKLSKLYYLPFIWILLLAISFSGCRKDDDPEPDVITDNEVYYDFMQQWYYWTDEIPDIDPNAYGSMFEVLEAVRYQPLDRWSYIADLQEILAYFQDSRIIGYGLGTRWDADNKLRVSHIFNTTEMYAEGIRRSWIIEEINGGTLSAGMNINQLLGANAVGVTNTFLFRKPDGELKEITLAKQEVTMNSILHHQIFEENGLKIGYMVLQGFTSPTKQELEDLFATFTAEGIDELILDMRYNGGGLTDIATQLASLIGGPSLEGEPFFKYIYNQEKGEQYNTVKEFQNEANSLNLNRLITIATRSTASASELIINGLRPFMDVVIIGNTTYGKPMGANLFNYKDVWAFAPITFAIRNADNEGDYFDGLEVNLPASDDLSKMWGDPEEASLQQALSFITTGVAKSMDVNIPDVKQPWEYMHGLQREIGVH